MDWTESGKKIREENEEACLGVTAQTQTVKVRCKSESESAGEKEQSNRQNIFDLQAQEHFTDCVLMCVLQASKYSEQMCLNETGCQQPQEESKTFFFSNYKMSS